MIVDLTEAQLVAVRRAAMWYLDIEPTNPLDLDLDALAEGTDLLYGVKPAVNYGDEGQ